MTEFVDGFRVAFGIINACFVFIVGVRYLLSNSWAPGRTTWCLVILGAAMGWVSFMP